MIVGAGGFGRETAEAVAALNRTTTTWELLGFADDDPTHRGAQIAGLTVIGSPVEIAAARPDAQFVVCTGRPDAYFSRAQLVRRLALKPNRYATIVHPAASIAASASIGPGSVLLAGTVVTAQARIGSHVAIMPGTIITHDDSVADFVTLASGVRLGGSVSIGRGAYVGAGTLIREDLEVGEWSMVGMGSVVTRSVPDAECWLGAPARFRSKVQVPKAVLT